MTELELIDFITHIEVECRLNCTQFVLASPIDVWQCAESVIVDIEDVLTYFSEVVDCCKLNQAGHAITESGEDEPI